MVQLMNEIAVKLPDKWQDIGRGLGLEEHELKQIQAEHGWQQSTNQFFSSVFEKWHSGESLAAVATCNQHTKSTSQVERWRRGDENLQIHDTIVTKLYIVAPILFLTPQFVQERNLHTLGGKS